MEGVRKIPLRRFEDERGWFVELHRASWFERPMRQTNVSFSRQGVIRGLHYHERGQDDLFVCLQGRLGSSSSISRAARPSPRTSATRTRCIYVRGRNAHGFEAITDLLFRYHVTEEYDPEDPDEHEVLGRSSRPRPLEHPIADPVGPGRKRIVITGAGGQLGPGRRGVSRGGCA